MKHEWEFMWSTRLKICHACMKCNATVIELIGIDGTKPPEEGCEPGKLVPINLAKGLIPKPPNRSHTLSNDELAEAIGVTIGLIKSMGSLFVDGLKKHLELLLEEQARRAKVPYENFFR